MYCSTLYNFRGGSLLSSSLHFAQKISSTAVVMPKTSESAANKKKSKSSNNVRNVSSKAAKQTNDQIVQVIHNEETGISTISMFRPPVNSLNIDLCVALTKALQSAAENNSRGIILTSSLSLFSAGFDLKTMHNPDPPHLKESWRAFQELWLTLYGMGIPTACAINGECPGAGCMLALACEYRVMVQGEHTTGLVGTKIGLATPNWINDTMVEAIGRRQAERALMRSTLFKPDEALKIGLIDEIATNKSDALVSCEKYISSFFHIPQNARGQIKLKLRQVALEKLQANRDSDASSFVESVQQAHVQAIIGKFFQSRKK